MSITVFGAGGVGGHVAARLALAGNKVNLIARGAHLEAIRSHGLRLQVRDVIHRADVVATDSPEGLGVQDILIVSVKRMALAGIIDALAPMIGGGTRLVFIMNGLPWWFDNRDGKTARDNAVTDLQRYLDPQGRLASLAPLERQVWSVVTSGGAIVAPGTIKNTTPENTIRFGYADDRNDGFIAGLVELFAKAGYNAAIAKDIRAEIWRKILVNAGQAAVATVTNRNHLQVTSDAHTRGVIMAMIDEMLQVGSAIGIHLDNVDPRAMTSPGLYGEHIPSLLQDLRNGRPLEIDATILAVRELARSKNVPIPHLQTVAAIIGALSHS